MSSSHYELINTYTKNASFEAPGLPFDYHELPKAKTEISIRTNISILENPKDIREIYEVSLLITLKGISPNKTIYIAEIEQCGLFNLAHQTFDVDKDYVLNVDCTNDLFSYARVTIATLLTNAGLMHPPLEPFNFKKHYTELKKQGPKH